MASMASIGVVQVPRSSSNVGKKAIQRNLSFSASQLSGDKVSTATVSGAGNGRCTRKHLIVTPKAVSDSQNSQTCLDPDASRVSTLTPFLCFLNFLFTFYCSCILIMTIAKC